MKDKPTAVTKKGARTRQRIVESAKHLFHKKGYGAVAVMDICQAAGVGPGTMTYYFKTKYDVVRELYGSVFQRSYDFVAQWAGRLSNALEENVLVAFVYYQGLCADVDTRRFHLEILERSSVRDYIADRPMPVARRIVDDLNLGLTEKELQYVEMAWHGVSREMFIDFLKKDDGRTIKDVINLIYIFRARLLTADENAMKVYLYNGMKFVQDFDHSHITLLGAAEGAAN